MKQVMYQRKNTEDLWHSSRSAQRFPNRLEKNSQLRLRPRGSTGRPFSAHFWPLPDPPGWPPHSRIRWLTLVLPAELTPAPEEELQLELVNLHRTELQLARVTAMRVSWWPRPSSD